MLKLSLKMLLGDKPKYWGLVAGVAFATLLITQQVSIFVGLMSRTAGVIYGVKEADIWVMDKRVRYIEEVEPMRDIELYNVRGVEGVQWAVPFYKGLYSIRMLDGLTQQVQLIGVDDMSLVGLCSKVVLGDPLTIQEPQKGMIDLNGYHFTWPDQKLELNKYVELNDNRLMISAVCDANPTFFTFPIIYVSYNTVMEMIPPQRKRLPFVLVKVKSGYSVDWVKEQIEKKTELQALTQEEFAWRSIRYILERTGIAINFGLTIFLGALIGAAITAQTLYIFVTENLKQFGAMKAIGFTNKQLAGLVMIQAAFVGFTGYGLGIGITASFLKIGSYFPAFKGFCLHWQIAVGSLGLIILLICLSVVFSLRKLFKLDPSIVFRG
ncbi:MAG: ABC transporter permease [Rhabdochlamydiaceae bacterium]